MKQLTRNPQMVPQQVPPFAVPSHNPALPLISSLSLELSPKTNNRWTKGVMVRLLCYFS